MKYIHPDVLDNGLLHLRANAVRALLLSSYTAGMTYAQAVLAALASGTISSVDFAISDDGAGRKLVFSGANVVAMKSRIGGDPMHVALTDGTGRLLLVDSETSGTSIVVGKTYSIPAITYAVQQP